MKELNACEFLDVIKYKTGAEKINVLEMLENSQNVDEKKKIRTLLIEELKTDYAPSHGTGIEKDRTKTDARGWMLSSLGRVAEDDQESQNLLKNEIKLEIEKESWIRYWAFEGIIAGGYKWVKEEAQKARSDKDNIIRCTALAILARNSDSDALNQLVENIKDRELLKPTLRALRIAMIPDARIVTRLKEIVKKGENAEGIYDAIFALGRVPYDDAKAGDCARTLEAYIRENRWPSYDSNRTNAIDSLGLLKSPDSVNVLLETLVELNPHIVQQASVSLEKILGTRGAARQIIMKAAQCSYPADYTTALRYLKRDETIEELTSKVAVNSDESHVALMLLTEMGGLEAFNRVNALNKKVEDYAKTQKDADGELQKLLDKSLEQPRLGFKVVMLMDSLIFFGGFVLFGIGLFLLFKTNNPWENLTGAVSSITGLFAAILQNWLVKSRNRIEPSARRLLTLQTALNGQFRQLRQIDLAYTQSLMEGKLDTENVCYYSSMIKNATQSTLDLLHKYDNMEGKAEFTKSTKNEETA